MKFISTLVSFPVPDWVVVSRIQFHDFRTMYGQEITGFSRCIGLNTSSTSDQIHWASCKLWLITTECSVEYVFSRKVGRFWWWKLIPQPTPGEMVKHRGVARSSGRMLHGQNSTWNDEEWRELDKYRQKDTHTHIHGYRMGRRINKISQEGNGAA